MIHPSAKIHPTALIEEGAVIGEDVFYWAFLYY
ncbi:UDP-N-acetylglucosamine acetyltransferase [Haemophilus influenzae]|uniref:UDP-N-acetylglucosamine acetyltransferase n=1 Tax=Haemophilus influenzae TaxID=727 RepID=A0A2X1RSS7_HAEIF|nr:UDP-N-acetylglucosamine acetyltransferase [Haemophilus influenzae]